jgi:hypothetical protein
MLAGVEAVVVVSQFAGDISEPSLAFVNAEVSRAKSIDEVRFALLNVLEECCRSLRPLCLLCTRMLRPASVLFCRPSAS